MEERDFSPAKNEDDDATRQTRRGAESQRRCFSFRVHAVSRRANRPVVLRLVATAQSRAEAPSATFFKGRSKRPEPARLITNQPAAKRLAYLPCGPPRERGNYAGNAEATQRVGFGIKPIAIALLLLTISVPVSRTIVE
jgi:hypothetical protein